MNDNFKILGIPGSLRKASYNKYLLEAAREHQPDNMDIEIYDISSIPLYNGDLDGPNPPDAVVDFKKKIASSDGLLIATPEYNYSIPGVLKNAIDWASRPPLSSPLNMKPLAIMGSSVGNYGSVRAQLHLRQVAVFTNMMDMKRPELIIPRESEKFNSEGKLTDEPTIAQLKKFLAAFEKWILIFRD